MLQILAGVVALAVDVALISAALFAIRRRYERMAEEIERIDVEL